MRHDQPTAEASFRLHFTPAEWRSLLNDADFLNQPDNSYSPRRLMGLPVEIIADHRACLERIGWSGCAAARKGA
jgi:hypothetical protein